MDTATMETVTVNTKKKRSRIIILVVVSIFLLAGAALLWRNCFSTPDVLFRCPSTSHVCYMTAEDARTTRNILEQRDWREHWIKSTLKWACLPDYFLYFDHQIFGLNHLEDDQSIHFEYYTVDSDGEQHYVTSYYFGTSDDVSFFRGLAQKYDPD